MRSLIGSPWFVCLFILLLVLLCVHFWRKNRARGWFSPSLVQRGRLQIVLVLMMLPLLLTYLLYRDLQAGMRDSLANSFSLQADASLARATLAIQHSADDLGLFGRRLRDGALAQDTFGQEIRSERELHPLLQRMYWLTPRGDGSWNAVRLPGSQVEILNAPSLLMLLRQVSQVDDVALLSHAGRVASPLGGGANWLAHPVRAAYRGGSAHLKGVLLGALDWSRLPGASAVPTGMAFNVSDITERNALTLLAQSGGDAAQARSTDLALGGRVVRLSLAPTPAFTERNLSRHYWLVLPVGALLSLFLTSYVLLLMRRNELAERLAHVSAEAHQESEQRFRMFASVASDWFWETDRKGVLCYCSPHIAAIVGYAPDDLIGRSWQLLLGVNDPAVWREGDERILQAMLERSAFREFEFARVARDGQIRYLAISGCPVFSAHQHFCGFRGVGTDISARKQAEAELERHRLHLQEMVARKTRDLLLAKEAAEQANRSKSEFLANMSHELRTPMHGVLSFAEIGVNKAVDAERGKLLHYFKNIHSSGSRLLDLLNDLLDLSKLESGKMNFEMQNHDLCQVVRTCARAEEVRIEEYELHLDLDLPTQGAFAQFDPLRMAQVVSNLLSNAIKFSPQGGTVTLTIQCLSGALELTVSDQGPGVPEDELESIFDKFVQSSKTRSGAGGTGLGLSISQEIVLAHRGAIWASNGSNEGARFVVQLPCDSQQNRQSMTTAALFDDGFPDLSQP